MKNITILLCLLATGCATHEGLYTQFEFNLMKSSLEGQIDSLCTERDGAVREARLYAISSRIQTWYARQGINRPMALVYETVRQAFDISPNFPPPKGLTSETFAYYLITFASKETDFNPMVVGKEGDSGITQTLKRDYPRLIKKARKRGLSFKDDITNIRTGLICCAEEYSEKLLLSGGDLYDAVWKYNGAKMYAKSFYKRYEIMRYGGRE